MPATFTVSTPVQNMTIETNAAGQLTFGVSGSATYQMENDHVPEIYFSQDVRIYIDQKQLDVNVNYTGEDGPWSFSCDCTVDAIGTLGQHQITIKVSKTSGAVTDTIAITRDITVVRSPPSIKVSAPGAGVGRTKEYPEPAITFNVQASDAYSGLASAYFFLDDAPLTDLAVIFPENTESATFTRSVVIPYSKLTKRLFRVDVADRAGNMVRDEVALDDPDTWGPWVTFAAPTSTLPYAGSARGHVNVPVQFTVRDPQSGLARVEWRLDDGPFQLFEFPTPGRTDAVVFNFDVLVPGTEAPHSVAVRAVDSGMGNETTQIATFTIGPVVSDTIKDLLSRRTYLEHLLNFCTANVRAGVSDQSPQVSPAELTKQFIQPFLSLANGVIQGEDQLECDLLLPVRLLRTKVAVEVSESEVKAAVSDYHRRCYEVLLQGLGTSFGEIRNLRLLSVTARQNLAQRLGLWDCRPGAADQMDLLVAPAGTAPGSVAFETWLRTCFGLPFTDQLEMVGSSQPTSSVLAARQTLQQAVWSLEDASRAEPDADPDLMADDDLATAPNPWRSLLSTRRNELDKVYKTLLTLPDGGSAIAVVFTAQEQDVLRALKANSANGMDISSGLSELQIDQSMFVRLMSYMFLVEKGQELSLFEREDLAHLLVQRWKRNQRYGAWLAEEREIATRLWPDARTAAAWVPGHVRQGFAPWRATAALRRALVTRLNRRIKLWNELAEQQAQAVSDAQRAALPGLRDALLGLPAGPSGEVLKNDLTQRWLIDFASGGSTSLSAVDQAISSMQTLINGVRYHWFAFPHPAFTWTVNSNSEAFDEQWGRMADFDSWRTAVNNYLYPENVLYPELKDDVPELTSFLTELSKIRPLTSVALQSPPDTYKAALAKVPAGDSRLYFVPVAIGLAFQRAGLNAAALDQYRQVYDPALGLGARKKVAILSGEDDDEPPVADFGTSNWIGRLSDPHTLVTKREKGKGRCNPYTRFTLFQILKCLLAQADDGFASGSRDGRARALSIYLEAEDILAFRELQDRTPNDPTQVYLPSPVLASMRNHVASALRKIRLGLSYLGTPLPPEAARDPSVGMMSSLMRPTVYHYRTLIERSKLLAAQAQQFEDKYLSAIERGDAETEKYLSTGFGIEAAQQTINLKALQAKEATDSVTAVQGQLDKSQMQADRYEEWIAAGPTANELKQIEMIWAAKTARDVIAVADGVIAGTQAIVAGVGLDKQIFSAGVAALQTVIQVAGIATRSVAQGYLNGNEAGAQVSSILASQERRTQEWQFQLDLASQDVAIAGRQVRLALDRVAIATQETTIATSQRDQARQMLAFLGSKFTSARFYQWFIGELAQIYATFLRLATAAASNAEKQLAFERQELALGLIKTDYWLVALNAAASTVTAPDGSGAINPRGITGSSRLLQDIYTLDEQAFSSDRRLLNLTQSFSLAQAMPMEFEEFRHTGSLAFTTPMHWFDEGFPGHYMRMIKRVRLSVSALIPPLLGIRATLSNSGFSRVVTGDSGYPLMTLHHDPQVVALCSAVSATGVFDLDAQAEILLPFEGTGVDTTWYMELSPAGNFFNFASLFDVVVTIDYTAKFSSELRDRVVKNLPREYSGDRTWSVKREMPDTWYDAINSSGDAISITFSISETDFPPGLSSLGVAEVSVFARTITGAPASFQATMTISFGDGAPSRTSRQATSIQGLVSSRQASASSWHHYEQHGKIEDVLDDLPPIAADKRTFLIRLEDANDANSLLQQIRTGEIDDLMVTLTLTGLRPAWRGA